MDSGQDSVDLLKKLFDRFESRVNYLIVLNQLRGGDFGIFDKSEEKKRALALNAKFVSLKRLHEPVIAKIDAGSTSFWAAKKKSTTEVKGLGILERQRLKFWLKHAYEEIERAGICGRGGSGDPRSLIIWPSGHRLGRISRTHH